MSKFSIGDRVVLSNPVLSCRDLKNTEGIIIEIDEWRLAPILKVDTLGANQWWTADQFELANINLENK